MLGFIFDLSGTKAEGDGYYNAVFGRFQTLNLAGLSEHPNTKTLMGWVRGKIQEADQWANQLANGKITEDAYATNMKNFAAVVIPVIEQIQQMAMLPYGAGGNVTLPPSSSGGGSTTPPQTNTGGKFSLENPLGSSSMSPVTQWGILGGGALVVFLALNGLTRRR